MPIAKSRRSALAACAVMAVFALSGQLAANAHAEQAYFSAEAGTVSFRADQLEGREAPFVFDAGFSCYAGGGGGPAAELQTTLGETSLTIEQCEVFGLDRNWETNGCHYVFHAGQSVAPGVSHGDAAITCTTKGSEMHFSLEPWGNYYIPPQSETIEATYTNQGEGQIRVELESHNLHYRDYGTYYTDGYLSDTLIMSGYNSKHQLRKMWVYSK